MIQQRSDINFAVVHNEKILKCDYIFKKPLCRKIERKTSFDLMKFPRAFKLINLPFRLIKGG